MSWFIWDAKSWKLRSRIRLKEKPMPAAIEASWIGFFSQRFLVDWDTGRTICRIEMPERGSVNETRLLRDKKSILGYYQGGRTDFYRDHSLWLFDLSGSCIAKEPVSSSLFPAAFSQDGQDIATMDLVPAPAPFPGLEVLDKAAQGPIRLWRVQVK